MRLVQGRRLAYHVTTYIVKCSFCDDSCTMLCSECRNSICLSARNEAVQKSGMRPFRFMEIVRIFINTVRKELIKRYHGNDQVCLPSVTNPRQLAYIT